MKEVAVVYLRPGVVHARYVLEPYREDEGGQPKEGLIRRTMWWLAQQNISVIVEQTDV